MFILRYDLLKQSVIKSEMTQKAISEKVGIPEPCFCLMLKGKRKCEAGEYASLCNILHVPIGTFLEAVLPEENDAG